MVIPVTFTRSTIGAAGDYATIKLWDSAYPNTAGQRWTGTLIDAVYDEDDINITTVTDEDKAITLANAPGQRPIIRPDVNATADKDILTFFGAGVRVFGIIFDGINKASVGNALVRLREDASLYFSEARNSPSHGIQAESSSGGGGPAVIGCLVHNNSGHGIKAGNEALITCCTIVKNGGWGVFELTRFYIGNSLIFGNASGSISNLQREAAYNTWWFTGWCSIDDTRYSDIFGAIDYWETWVENATPSDYFTDYANDDFTLKTGSPALLSGCPVANWTDDKSNTYFTRPLGLNTDVYQNILQIDSSKQYDRGAHQKSYAKTIVIVNINSPIIAAIEQQVDIP